MIKNVSIIMGRGIEGCGVTKFTIEQCKYYEQNDINYKIFASKDKSWTRKNAHNVSNINLLKFAKDDEVNELIDNINKSDVAIINSLPALSFKDEAISNFKRMLSEVKIPIVLIQHDHAIQSIKRNAALNEAISRANVIFAHSVDNPFSKYANGVLDELKTFPNGSRTNILPFQPGMNFDDVKSKYWKSDLNSYDVKHHKWIGRTTSWKGYKEMFKFHNEFLKPNSCLTTYEGIERSPAYIGFKDLSEYIDLLKYNPDEYDFSNSYGDHVHVFGPYIQHDMLKRMSSVGFGYQLSKLKPDFIDKSIEYTHCEVVCTGTIPVFNKKYGDECTHRYYNKKLTECDNSGTIWFDEDNLEETLAQMQRINADPKERERMRNDAFEFYKLHQDSSYTFNNIMEKIKNEI